MIDSMIPTKNQNKKANIFFFLVLPSRTLSVGREKAKAVVLFNLLVSSARRRPPNLIIKNNTRRAENTTKENSKQGDIPSQTRKHPVWWWKDEHNYKWRHRLGV